MQKYLNYFTALLIFTICNLPGSTLANNAAAIDHLDIDLKAYSDGKVYRSITILEDILTQEPSNHRARLELASAYYHLSLYDAALEQLGIVISAENLPKNVAGNTIKFIKKIQKSRDELNEKNKKISLELKLFTGFDSNANLGPPDKTLDIGILPVEYVAAEDTLFGAQLDIAHQYRFSGSTNIKDYAVYSYWESKLSLYTQQYDDQDQSSFNLFRFNSGPLFKINPLLAAKINFKIDHYEFYHRSLATIYSLKPQLKLQIKTNQYIGINFEYSDRQFHANNDKYREGKQLQSDIYFTHRLTDSFKYKLGISFKNRSLESNYLSYNSVKYQLLIEKKLNSKNLLQFITNYEKYHYDGIERYYDDNRDDNFFRSRLKYEYKLSDNISMGIEYTHFNRRSNHELHTYERNIFETYLSYKY